MFVHGVCLAYAGVLPVLSEANAMIVFAGHVCATGSIPTTLSARLGT